MNFLAQVDVKSLVISGGEPFLRTDLESIVDLAIEFGIERITIVTNGTVINTRVLNALKGKVEQIAVSIDGYSEDCVPYIRKQQRFSTLKDSIKLIQDAGILTHIIPTIHSKNFRDIRHYLKLAKDINSTINFSLLSYPNNSPEVAALLPGRRELLEIGRECTEADKDNCVEFRDTPISVSLCARKNCGLGQSILSIDANGEVFPCHMLHDEEFSFGNAFYTDPDAIWNSPLRNKIINIHVNEIDECSECEYKYLCGGGCRTRSFFSTGRLTRKDSYCDMIKQFFEGYESKIKSRRKQ